MQRTISRYPLHSGHAETVNTFFLQPGAEQEVFPHDKQSDFVLAMLVVGF
jgi:hypothetical protein